VAVTTSTLTLTSEVVKALPKPSVIKPGMKPTDNDISFNEVLFLNITVYTVLDVFVAVN
jgi:hypothetical protein